MEERMQPRFQPGDRVRGDRSWLPASAGTVESLKPSTVQGWVCWVRWDGRGAAEGVHEQFLAPLKNRG